MRDYLDCLSRNREDNNDEESEERLHSDGTYAFLASHRKMLPFPDMIRHPSLCCFVALIALVIVTKAAEDQAPRTLRLLTYNVHHGKGSDGKLDLDRVALVIKAANPDIVAVQEIDQRTRRSGDVDQAARLGELTSLHSVFGKAMDYQGGAYGLALLARWPVIASQTHSLPADEGIEPRAVLEAHVRIEKADPK